MVAAKTVHTKNGGIGRWHSTEETRKSSRSAITQVSVLVLPLYVFAILCAIAHLLFFRHLDGRRLEIDTDIPQSWIAPISFLIGLAFRSALCTCLSIVFVQHLWRIMMESYLSIRTIDRFYSLQRQFWTLFHVDNFHASPILVLLICLYWLTPIAVVFPSGALIVVGHIFSDTFDAKVPYFDPAHYGNGSFEDALKFSLAPDGEMYRYSVFEGPVSAPNILLSSAAISLISERTYDSPSPCGANCTYSIEFQGPYVQCIQSRTNETFDGRAILMEIEPFSGAWDDPGNGWKQAPNDDEGGTFVPDTFTFTTQVPYTWWIREDDTDQNVTFCVTPSTALTCTPGRADYTVNVSYISGEAAYQVDTKPIDDLVDTWYTGSLDAGPESFSFNNSEHGVDNLRGTNLWLLIDSLVETLDGRVVCESRSDNGTEITLENVKAPNGQMIEKTEAAVVYCYMPAAQNSTSISDTLFNTRRFARGSESPEFVITQDLLNEALANITLSTMNRLQLWSTTTKVTQHNWANYYHFATPTRLIVSYFGSLALALPFIALGFISLRRNGAVAPAEGLVDMLVLGAKSDAIRDAVKYSSFENAQRGDEKKSLHQLRVRYGDFGDHLGEEKAPGLGVEHELKPAEILETRNWKPAE